MARAKVQDFEFEYENAEEFNRIKREVFTEHQYYVDLETKTPRIIDAGAHLGLATGYFKWLYPEAEIIAIEPNPRTALTLERNVITNQWWGVEVVEAALIGKKREDWVLGKVAYYFDRSEDHWFSTGGLWEGAWNGKQKSWRVEVKARMLDDFLGEPVDLLKLDIEGAEGEVLEGATKLKQVKRMVMEYHPMKHNPWERIKAILDREGYEVTMKNGKKKDEGLKLVEAVRKEW